MEPPANYGAWDVQKLITGLDSEKSMARCEAAQALGRLRSTQAVEPLIQHIHHLDVNTKIAVIEALGNIGDRRPITPLASAMRAENFEALEAIKRALARLGATDAAIQAARARNISRSASFLERPGVLRMISGGAFLAFRIITALTDYFTCRGFHLWLLDGGAFAFGWQP